jgi:transcriptional regulator with XRE-family HTH domain
MTRERSKEQIPLRKPKSRKEKQAANAPFSLQRWLFDLFRILGIEQKTIAVQLGVSKTMVSFWANDREQISRYYLEMLHELAFTTLVENNKQALLAHEQFFDFDFETLRERFDRDELRKILTQDAQNRENILRQLLSERNEEVERQFHFYYERHGQLQDMRIALSNVASALCEKVAAEYREVSNFIEPRPERPLHKMLRISRETRDSLKKGCRDILSDLEQLDDLLWFEEIFIREPIEASNEQSPDEMSAQLSLQME